MDYSEPLIKALDLLEQLSRNPARAQSVAELSKSTGIAKSTLVRMLNTLEERGYIHKDDGRCIGEFELRKKLPFNGAQHERVRMLCRELHKRCGQQIELIGVSGNDLYWHETWYDSDAPVRVAAKAGFRRTLYELDAPSRLYLARLVAAGAAGLVAGAEAFYRTGPDCQRTTAEACSAIIAATDPDACTYDAEGNSNGIRRFAVLIRHPGTAPEAAASTLAAPAPALILALAEAALPRADPARHAEEIIGLLLEARTRIEATLASDRTAGPQQYRSKEKHQ